MSLQGINLHNLQWKHIHMEQGIRGNFAFFPLRSESQVLALHCNSSWELLALTPSSPCPNLRLITQEVPREDLQVNWLRHDPLWPDNFSHCWLAKLIKSESAENQNENQQQRNNNPEEHNFKKIKDSFILGF